VLHPGLLSKTSSYDAACLNFVRLWRKGDPVVTDVVVAYLAGERRVRKFAIDGTGSVFSRLRASKKALGAAHNFVGMVGDEMGATAGRCRVTVSNTCCKRL